MADPLSLPIAEIAARLDEGKLKARTLAEAAIANHERFGQDAKLRECPLLIQSGHDGPAA